MTPNHKGQESYYLYNPWIKIHAYSFSFYYDIFSVCVILITLNIFTWTKDDQDLCFHTASVCCSEFMGHLNIHSSVRVHLQFLVRTSSIMEQLIDCQWIYFLLNIFPIVLLYNAIRCQQKTVTPNTTTAISIIFFYIIALWHIKIVQKSPFYCLE